MHCDFMRLISLFLSLALHAAVITAGFYSSMGSSVHIDLGKRVYTVDLITLGSSVQPKAPAPSGTKAVHVSPSPKPAPKVLPSSKTVPKSVQKISPKKVKKASKRVRKAPVTKTKKIVSSKQILAQALKGVQSQVAGQEQKDRHALARELAGLQKQVGKNGGVAGTGSNAQGSGLMQVYGQLAESVIKEHWRFPRVGGDNLVAQVEVRIDQTGNVLQSTILMSSGRTDFDASAQRAIQEAGQLPKPPSPDIRRLVINFNLHDLAE